MLAVESSRVLDVQSTMYRLLEAVKNRLKLLFCIVETRHLGETTPPVPIT